MSVRAIKSNNGSAARRSGSGVMAASVAAALAFTVTVAAPLSLDLRKDGQGLLVQSVAQAKNDGGGNGGGGNGGGGNGGGNGGGGNGGGAGGNGGGAGSGGGGAGGGTGGGGSSGVGSAQGTLGDGGRDAMSAGSAMPNIGMAAFTTKIKKRYPADDIAVLENPNQPVSFFSELNSMTGRTITHRWVYHGVVQYETSFTVKASHWRVWSTQLLPADRAGEWTVEVVDADKKVLATHSLIYRPSP